MVDHTANCLTSAIAASEEIATAMCVINKSHGAQKFLCRALQSTLNVAEEARQAWEEQIQEPTTPQVKTLLTEEKVENTKSLK